jgi:hypothetical protein
MIISKTYDVEILPNFFSITIIDVADYLKTFEDCHNDTKKKKAIPITQKYSVREIKDKLANIKKDTFYITDTDDSQLLSMLAYLNGMQPHKNDKGERVITDMFGYNSYSYDKLMVSALLMFATNVNSTKELITKLYETSQKIISLQNDKDVFKNDIYIQTLNRYKLPYRDIDLMRIFALNKAGVGVDDKGEKVYFSKSLKQTSINLQWYELLEFELPPITEIDAHFYQKNPRYKGLIPEQLNTLIDKWDRYIIDDWIEPTLFYNANDCFILCEIIRLNSEEIRSRYAISAAYGVNVLNSSRSNVADTLFDKFYSDFSGLHPTQWKGRKTERTHMAFKRVILPHIKFKTPELQDLLKEMMDVTITSIGKSAFQKNIKLGNLTYTIATGGLHSQDIPRELKSKIEYNVSSTGEDQETDVWDKLTDDSYIYTHWDIASFYPRIISKYNVAPAHLDEKTFVKLVTWLTDSRIKAKHSKEEYIDGIAKDVFVLVLKIVVNSIYGKLGYEWGDICDRLAVLKVTINGQLMIMMLCEELELNGIEVISANTDGLVIKLYKKDKELFDKIANSWKEYTQLEADAEEYDIYVNRDINNYVCRELNGKFTYKGALNPTMHLVDLQKGYDMPIVAKAVVDFFVDNKPILETLYEARNILDFCKTQNVGRQYEVEFVSENETNVVKCQRNNRFYVSTNGGVLQKVNKNNKSINRLAAGKRVTVLNSLDDMRIEMRGINYDYYYKECLKIIDPIKLSISPTTKANPIKRTKSGKALIKKYQGSYNTLFDDNEQ